MWLSISLLGLLLISLASQSGGRSISSDDEEGDKKQEIISHPHLRFPEGFYRAEDEVHLNYSDFVDEMHQLAWTMCDQFRKIVIRLENHEYHSLFGRQFLLFQLQSNPMEPRYHDTCLQLFSLYPDMEQRLRDKTVADLPDSSSGEPIHYDVPF